MTTTLNESHAHYIPLLVDRRRRALAERIAAAYTLSEAAVYEELYYDSATDRVKIPGSLYELVARESSEIDGPVRIGFEGDISDRVCHAEATLQSGQQIECSVKAKELAGWSVLGRSDPSDADLEAVARKRLLRRQFPSMFFLHDPHTPGDHNATAAEIQAAIDASHEIVSVSVGPGSSRGRQVTEDEHRQSLSGEDSQDVDSSADSLAARFESEIRNCEDLGELGNIEARIHRVVSLSRLERAELLQLTSLTRSFLLRRKST